MPCYNNPHPCAPKPEPRPMPNDCNDSMHYASLAVAMVIDQPCNSRTYDLCTAFMKLLFPHVQSRNDISQEEFEHYCLRPAMEMRGVIKKQLCIIDPKEFDVPGKRDIPEITYNS